MFEIKGKYNTAKVFSDRVEESAVNQLRTLIDQPFVEGSKIAVMPDVHAGKGCTIGYTMTLPESGYICPSLVGVDIGCGVYALQFNIGRELDEEDFKAVDEVIKTNIPSGRNLREGNREIEFDRITTLHQNLIAPVNKFKMLDSIGTLGGGNHFIEIAQSAADHKDYFLVIHTGSRGPGSDTANYWQRTAIRKMEKKAVSEAIARLKSEGRETEIQAEIRRLSELPKTEDDLCYLWDRKDIDGYLNDMHIMQEYAAMNRRVIANIIMREMGWSECVEAYLESVHNYIGDDNILRKGAIELREDQVGIIPFNMKVGSVIVVGGNNTEYNYSAPHGAGRAMSRKQAKETLSLEDYQKEMQFVYSSSVCKGTIDESPMAYKDYAEIIRNYDNIKRYLIIFSVYNFKAGGEA